MLVVGTSALVYPATAYIQAARRKGARVAVVDIA
jgi:NAD-dependent SIR2 family protein deacetylase